MKNKKHWIILFFLVLVSLPIIIMYGWLFIDSVTIRAEGSILPEFFSLKSWRFLWSNIDGHGSVWVPTFNTFIFASSVSAIVVCVSITAGYALSRLNFPHRSFYLSGILMLHAFPSVTLLISIYVVLKELGLYNTLQGIILVKVALELPFAIWLMKGFYDSVPWELEMAGIQDGASRFTVWLKIILPQIKPAIAAVLIFSFISGWGEYILPLVLAPSSDVQTLSIYLGNLVNDDKMFDFGLFKAIGLFYMLPVLLFYIFTQDKLMNIYGGGNKG